MIQSMKAGLLILAMLAGLAVIGSADAQQPDPPPLSEQPAQRTFDVHISPPQCTEIHNVVGVECVELGERWRCPVGLKPEAVHRTSADLTYAETIGVWPPLRDTHCLFVGFEKAVPVRPYENDRPILTCFVRYVNGDVVETSQCQTRAWSAPVAAAPTATPVPNPTPSVVCGTGTVGTSTFNPATGTTTTSCVAAQQPLAVPVPSFTG